MCARLYIAVRADMTAGAQLAQAVHAMGQWAADHPANHEVWHRHSNWLVVVAVPDQHTILDLDARAARYDMRRSVIREPDMDNEVTAIALAPGDEARRLCANYPCALKGLTMT